MSIVLKITVLLSLLVSLQAKAAFEPCVKPMTKGALAAQKFSPYTAMFWTSQFTLLAAAGSLANNKDEQERMQTTNLAGGLFWLANSMFFLSSSNCPKNDKVDIDTLTAADVDVEFYHERERFFYVAHAINTTVLLIDSGLSTKDNKRAIVAGAVVSPFLVDILNRWIFSPDKLSPYSGPQVNQALILPKDDGAMATIGIQF